MMKPWVDEIEEIFQELTMEEICIPCLARNAQEQELIAWFQIVLPILYKRRRIVSISTTMNFSYIKYELILFKQTYKFVQDSITDILGGL